MVPHALQVICKRMVLVRQTGMDLPTSPPPDEPMDREPTLELQHAPFGSSQSHMQAPIPRPGSAPAGPLPQAAATVAGRGRCSSASSSPAGQQRQQGLAARTPFGRQLLQSELQHVHSDPTVIPPGEQSLPAQRPAASGPWLEPCFQPIPLIRSTFSFFLPSPQLLLLSGLSFLELSFHSSCRTQLRLFPM